MIDHKVVLDWLGPKGWRAAHLARLVVWRITRPQRLGVFGIVFNPAGQVLLVENSYAPGWRLPGGGVDFGETIAETLVRELQEEIGVTSTTYRLLGVYQRFQYGASNQLFAFTVTGYEGEPKADGIEILRLIWADPAHLPEGVEPGTARRIAEAYSGTAVAQRW